MQEWKLGSVYREIYVVPYAAPAASADSAELRLTLLDPATNQPWSHVNTGDAAPHTVTTLKIAR